VYYNPASLIQDWKERRKMELLAKHQRGLLIGAIVGAILGVGTAYLLIAAPSDLEEGEERKPVTVMEMLTLTGAVFALIRRFDDLRRRTQL
jgi:hypothetical protein